MKRRRRFPSRSAMVQAVAAVLVGFGVAVAIAPEPDVAREQLTVRSADPLPMPIASELAPDMASDASASERPSSPRAPKVPVPTPPLRADTDQGFVVDVRTYGAIGNGLADDTGAIQRANDAVAEAGGGTVSFPPGVYVAAEVKQDSFVEFRGTHDAVLKHPDGSTTRSIIRARRFQTKGSIESGTNVLRVDDVRGLIDGAAIAVRGAGGGSREQYSHLASATTNSTGVFELKSARGFSTGSTYTPNYLLVDREVISYQQLSGRTLKGVRRGLLGTEPAAHLRGARVAQLTMLLTSVVRHTRGGVLLARPATMTVRSADVWIGSVGLGVHGLAFDGSRKPGGAPDANPMSIHYELVDSAVIERCLFRNGDDGAVKLDRSSRRSTISDSTFVDNGSPDTDGGAAVWVFRGSSNNLIRDNVIGGRSYSGIYVDDRTVASTEWDASSSGNVIEANEIEIPRDGSNSAIAILGSSDNVVRSNAFTGTAFGVRVYTGGQGATPPETARNVVIDNAFSRHTYGIWVDGARNRFLRNRFASIAREDVVDEGRDNEFE